jgi:hypothetical protein
VITSLLSRITRAFTPFWQRPVVPTPPVDVAAMEVYRRSKFPADGGPVPWLDRPDAHDRIAERLASGEITPNEADLCRKWARDGYVILEAFYSPALMDETWAAYEAAIATGQAKPPPHPIFYDGDPLPGRLQNVHCFVPAMDRMFHEPRVNRVISVLLGAKSKPLQTIIGHKATEQKEHSDSIHMTTYPAGYVAATWLAYEDIGPDCGPLVYYPGSHKLPYLLSEDLGIAPTQDYGAYGSLYEPAIQRLIAERGFERKHFTAKKGDVLVWHANLLHGGSRRNNYMLSRKALVCHYLAEGVVSYHDLFGTPTYVQLGLDLYEGRRPLPLPKRILNRALKTMRGTVGA